MRPETCTYAGVRMNWSPVIEPAGRTRVPWPGCVHHATAEPSVSPTTELGWAGPHRQLRGQRR